jgi:MFS family permease
LFWILWQRKKSFWMFVILFMVCCSYAGVSKMFGQTSAVSSTYQNKERSSYYYMSGNSFQIIAPTFGRSQSFSFLSVGTLKPSSVFSVNWKWRLFTNAICMPVKPFILAPGALKWSDIPWSDVSTRVLIQVEGIWGMCCELWHDKQSEVNSY